MAVPPAQNEGGLQAEIAKYRKALQENPDSRMYAPLANAFLRAGDVKAAIQVAEEGMKKHPKYLSGIVILAQAYQAAENMEKALELFLQVVRMSPENIAAQRGIAEIYDRQGKHAEALGAYKVLTLLDPTDKKAKEKLALLEATAPPPLPLAAGGQPAAEPQPAPPAEVPEEKKEPPSAEPPAVVPPPAVSPGKLPAVEEEFVPRPVIPTPSEPGPPEAISLSDFIAEPPLVPPSAKAPPLPPEAAEPPSLSELMEQAQAAESGEETTELEAPAAVDQEKEAPGDETTATLPLGLPEEHPAVPPPFAPAEWTPTDDQSAELAGGQAAEKKSALPGPGEELRTKTGRLTVNPLSEEEKLDLFFAGVELSELESSPEEQGGNERLEAEDTPLSESVFDPALPGFGQGLVGDPELRIIRSRFARYFWEEGSYDRALILLAEEVLETPEDKKLRAEFENMARLRRRDPDLILNKVRNLTASLKSAVPCLERKQETEGEERAAGKREETPLDEAAVTRQTAWEAGEKSKPETDSGLPGQERLQVLKGYLEKIRQDKEKKP